MLDRERQKTEKQGESGCRGPSQGREAAAVDTEHEQRMFGCGLSETQSQTLAAKHRRGDEGLRRRPGTTAVDGEREGVFDVDGMR